MMGFMRLVMKGIPTDRLQLLKNECIIIILPFFFFSNKNCII